MRRILGFMLALAVIIGLGMALPGVTRGWDAVLQVTLPGTNTPLPTVLAFATNTPAGPSATPSDTPSPSATFTATFTPSFTPTNTSTPTDTPSPTATPNGPFVYPEGVNPLTGLPYPNAEA